MLTESERDMWSEPEKRRHKRLSDHEIDEKYEKGEQRIVTESNREKLPNFVKAMEKPGYLDVRPFYQRRPRWDAKKQSKLIESFIMNVPVPPVFLYEKRFNQYEVMDGQQRITSIQRFYSNQLKLVGLESWPELNGKRYLTLPTKVRAGVDRRSLSSIVLMKESAPTEEADWLLKRMVFERLNTGGQPLSRQEIRNCLYHGRLNQLLLDLSKNSIFRKAWGVPDVPFEEGSDPPKELADNKRFKKMTDAQLVLRFFALRHWEKFSGGMQVFLDRYMIRSKRFSDEDFEQLRDLFEETIEVCAKIFDDRIFRSYDPEKGQWERVAHESFSDAVMVGVSNHLEEREVLISRKRQIVANTKKLFMTHPPKTFTGAGNTKIDVQNRIRLYDEMILSVVNS